jgi:hypothetical protein
LSLLFPNGEIVALQFLKAAPLSLVRCGIAAQRCLAFSEISLSVDSRLLDEAAMEKTIEELWGASPPRLTVSAPLVAVELSGLGGGAVIEGISVIDRFLDLRRRISCDLRRSPFEFNLVLDGVVLDDEVIVAQRGLGKRTVIEVTNRKIPYARIYFTNPENCRLILDVTNPEKTRWGDLAKQLIVGDPRTVGFECHRRLIERFYWVDDPRNDPIHPDQPFLCSLFSVRSDRTFCSNAADSDFARKWEGRQPQFSGGRPNGCEDSVQSAQQFLPPNVKFSSLVPRKETQSTGGHFGKEFRFD